jgi:hypothetical protein
MFNFPDRRPNNRSGFETGTSASIAARSVDNHFQSVPLLAMMHASNKIERLTKLHGMPPRPNLAKDEDLPVRISVKQES